MNIFRYIMLAITAVALLCACGDADDIGAEQKTDPASPPVAESDTLTFDARPQWDVTVPIDPTQSSMTLTVQLSDVVVEGLHGTIWTFQPKDDDLVAAFIGDECRGKTSPITLQKVLFFLPIGATDQDDPDAAPTVTVKYYSSALHHIFTLKEKIIFKKGVSLGKPDNPLFYSWEK